MNFSIKKLAQKIKIWDGTNTASINSSNELYTAVNSLGTTISVNNNSQLRATAFDSSGNEGQAIIGTNYVSGYSGIDAYTEAVNTIDYAHHEVHEGSHYGVCDFETFSNGQVVDFTMVTSDSTTWVHLTININSEGASSLEIYEGATVDAAGITVTPLNNNRNSDNTSETTVRSGDTFTDTGAKLAGFYSGANKQSGVIERANEIILKQNTTYLFRITNQTSSSNVISYCGEWYESASKN